MSLKISLVVASVVVLLAIPPLSGADLELGFDGCPPAVVEGSAGATLTFEIFTTITTSNNLESGGVMGWQYGVEIIGAVLQSASVAGVVVSTVYDNDGDPSTPQIDPKPLDLKTAILSVMQPATHYTDPSRKGIVSGIFLDVNMSTGQAYKWLHPNGTEKMGKVVIEVKVPDSETGEEVTLSYVDGLQGKGQPLDIRIWLSSDPNTTYRPTSLSSCSFTVRKQTGGLRIPGDANGDGGLDISDAVATLGFLFLGSPAKLPCGDGSGADPSNVKLVDWQQDGAIDISDAVAMLSFLFLGGHSHTLAVPGAETKNCIPIAGCQDHCGQ